MKLDNVEFIRSAASPSDFPNDNLKRIVMGGRSNVGKSSTINSITGRSNFARVSSSPGKTVFVNMFKIGTKGWLIDLPGYGYSKTSKTERERYSELIEEYLKHDLDDITRFYLIVDIRHKPTGDDKVMVDWVNMFHIPLTIIANKADKLKPSQIDDSIDLIRATLGLTDTVKVITFSAEKHTGRDELVNSIIYDLEDKR